MSHISAGGCVFNYAYITGAGILNINYRVWLEDKLLNEESEANRNGCFLWYN